MDNTGLIYVIIIVALIIKGVIDFIWKQSAKQAEILPPFDSKQKPQVITERKQPEKKKRKKQIATKPELLSAETHSPSYAAIERNQPEITPRPEEGEHNPVIIQDLDDMKKAVIYSEILNRKYN